MPIDPSLSMQVWGGGGQGAPAGAVNNTLNPMAAIGLMSQLAQTQNAMNQNRQFQQQFQARQTAGSIIAASPDIDTAVKNIYSNPSVMGFAPEIPSQLKTYQTQIQQLQLLQQQTGVEALKGPQVQAETQAALSSSLASRAAAGEAGAATKKINLEAQSVLAGQNQTAVQALLQGALGAANDPSKLGDFMNARLATLPSDIQARATKFVPSIITALSHGLPADPDLAREQYAKNLTALQVGSNVSPDVIRNALGMVAPQLYKTTLPSGAEQTSVIGGGLVPGAPGTTATGSNPVTPISTGPSTTQGDYFKNRGTDMAGYQSALDEQVKMGANVMQTVQQAREAMESFRPGGGAEAYSKAAQIAQAFGAKQDLVDKIGNGNQAASTEFRKLMVNTAMGQIREQIPAGSKLSQMEFKSFNENNPNIDTDPRAINEIFNFWTKLYNRDSAEQQGLNQHLAEGKDISQWPAQWQQQLQSRGIMNPQITGGGVQSGVTHTWVPGKGLVPSGAP